MNIGNHVLYNDDKYEILWVYGNGNLELKKNAFTFALVHKSEVQSMNLPPQQQSVLLTYIDRDAY